MPPQRTMPALKATNMKTERTHEENQERAYIAASRRSDRSLEARVESARRASEIHKRRTGRALRVTEQDVLNEEMYEEEEDDLPLPYRQLTQHLTTGSAEFNRRLAAYLTNHVAVRSALDQIIRDSHGMSANTGENFVGNFGQTVTPATYNQALQSPVTFADSLSSTPSSPQTNFTPQTPNGSNGQSSNLSTQFHLGPLGLGTVNQGQHRTAPYPRRMSQHQPEQQAAQTMGWSEMNKASQFKLSPQLHNQAASTPPTPTSIRPPGFEAALARRMSMPAPQLGASSPVMRQTTRHSSMVNQTPSPASTGDIAMSCSPNSPVAQGQSKLKDVQFMNTSVSSSSEESKQGPTQMNNTTNDQMSQRNQADLGPLDLSLAQNAQELLYGDYNINEHFPSSFMGTTQHSTSVDNKIMYRKGNDNSSFVPQDNFRSSENLSKANLQNVDTTMGDSVNINQHNSLPFYGTQGEYDLGSLMMETSNTPSVPGMNRLDTSDFNQGNTVDELWQDFFASESFSNSDENNGPSVGA